jgi:putative oxidoreductase
VARTTNPNDTHTEKQKEGKAMASTSAVMNVSQRLVRLDRAAREFLGRVGPLVLRLSLGIVFVWFGLLKVFSASAVGGLVATTVPFESSWFVPVLGVVEVVIGLAFVTGRFVRAMLPVFVLHLAGTFLVLIVLPEVAFKNDNPLVLSIVGEFVVKNLVLLAAGLAVASGGRASTGHPGQSERPAGDPKKVARSRWAIVALIVPTVLLSACDSDDSTASPGGDASTIAVRDYEFEPGTVSVGVGDTVTWVWEGDAQHNVVGDGFESDTRARARSDMRSTNRGRISTHARCTRGCKVTWSSRNERPEAMTSERPDGLDVYEV